MNLQRQTGPTLHPWDGCQTAGHHSLREALGMSRDHVTSSRPTVKLNRRKLNRRNMEFDMVVFNLVWMDNATTASCHVGLAHCF